MTDLLVLRDRPPRVEHRLPHRMRVLSMALLIDWLDSRPTHTAQDNQRLATYALNGDVVAAAAAMITERLPHEARHDDGELEYLLYRTADYYDIAGYFDMDELPFAEDTYRRLHDVFPDCMSGLVNLAELEGRAGRESCAKRLLERALARATAATSARYCVPDSEWELQIRCALARLGREVGDSGPLLENARPDRLDHLIKLLEGWGPPAQAAIAANRAISVASMEQRIVLDAAMSEVEDVPPPPPAIHADARAKAAVQALRELQLAKHKRTEQQSPTNKSGGRLGTYVWLGLAAPFVLVGMGAKWFVGAWESNSVEENAES